jgi:hypothetical protein
MVDLQHQQLSAIAPRMRKLVFNPQADLGYDLFADALVWSDERPSLQECGDESAMIVSCLRSILHYRTTIILGAPDETFREIWEAAELLFPTWPGFDARRKVTSLVNIYKQMSESSEKSFLEWGSRLNEPTVAVILEGQS